jgi:predicted ester cyclase
MALQKRSLAVTIRTANRLLLVEKRLDAIGDFFTPGYVVHLTDRDMTGGYATVRKFLEALQRAFPDLRVVTRVFVESGNRVAWQRTLRGTHEGAFQGFPPTGRRIVWRDMLTSRFRGNRIAEDWAISDLAERLLLARKR